MLHAWFADALLVVHGLFIVWVVLGGLVVWWRAVLAWVHLPAGAWGVWISWSGSVCPLTPLEQSMRRKAGQAGYEGGFIDHYLGAVIYPAGLTADRQLLFGLIVLVINLLIYGVVIWRAVRRRRLA
jgi:hypothetical protein